MRAVVVVLIIAAIAPIARADEPVCADIVQCLNKCKAGDGFACSMDGMLVATVKKPDLAMVLALFSRGCTANDPFGCKQAAQMYDDGRGANKDHDKAMAIYAGACDRGSDAACIRLGRDRLATIASLKPPANAAATYAAGCDLGYIPACTELAGVSAPDVGFKIVDGACRAKDRWACRNLAMYYERGVGVTKDIARAKTLYLEMCNAGVGLACADLGVLIANTPPNNGVQTPEAVEAFHKGCLLGHLAACALEGQAFQLGTGAPHDNNKAAAIWVRACELGNAKACTKLGYLFADDTLVSHDYAKAMKLMQLACDHGDKEGCMGVGFLHADGHGVPVDVATGRAIVQGLCDRGYKPACERLSLLDTPAPATTPPPAPTPNAPKGEQSKSINYERLAGKWWQFDNEFTVPNLSHRDGPSMKIHTRYELKWWFPDQRKVTITGEAKVTVWIDTVGFPSTWRLAGKLDRAHEALVIDAYEKNVPGLPYGLRYCEPSGTFHFAGTEATPYLVISWPSCPALGTLTFSPRQ